MIVRVRTSCRVVSEDVVVIQRLESLPESFRPRRACLGQFIERQRPIPQPVRDTELYGRREIFGADIS